MKEKLVMADRRMETEREQIFFLVLVLLIVFYGIGRS
jgi:hypothetical protein